VTEILSASERAARIVRNVLHSSGRQPSTRSMVDLNAIVEETLSLRQHDQRAVNITATADLGIDLPPVFADAHQIQQVLLNLIINAEHAMAMAHSRGELTVRTKVDDRRQVAIVEVSDDGPGVPESVRSRIFDPFFTTKQARAGTGLGLAVAQALAHEHGGSIRLAQDRTEGATFVIELPTRDLAVAIIH
jgi:signal transduction histidine kinase